MISIQEYLKKCKAFLREKKVDSPELSAELIFAHCLNFTRLDVLLSRKILTKNEVKNILRLIKRRGQGEPLAYILGKKEFYGRDFFVNPSVLIPRPCTETIIDLCKTFYSKKDEILFLDVGVGSGNLAITLVLEFENFLGIGLDLSVEALNTARKNIEIYGVSNSLILVNSDLISSIKPNSVDLIVTNPPYLSPLMIEAADVEVKNYEPHLALLGGYNGLDVPKQIFIQAEDVLKHGGRILMELDSSQIEEMELFLKNRRCWEKVSSHKDLAGNLRIISAKLS
ncbi:peptide chain release factor N(5)-glutamine methyltransferase [Desulfothermus sp.]